MECLPVKMESTSLTCVTSVRKMDRCWATDRLLKTIDQKGGKLILKGIISGIPGKPQAFGGRSVQQEALRSMESARVAKPHFINPPAIERVQITGSPRNSSE